VVRNAEKISMTVGHPNPHNYHWLAAVILFGIVYLFVGVAFPNPSASSKTQFIWRLAAWLTCAVAFAIHIGFEHFRIRTSPRRTALHASLSVAVGAFSLAAAATIRALRTGTGNQRPLALALVMWANRNRRAGVRGRIDCGGSACANRTEGMHEFPRTDRAVKTVNLDSRKLPLLN
jgi:hypothetical protein